MGLGSILPKSIKLSLFQTQALSEWMGRGGVPAARDNQKALMGNQSQGPNCPVGDYTYFGTQDTEMPLRRNEKSGKVGRKFPDFHF